MTINADEVNTGHSFGEDGYVHLVLYPSAEQLRTVAEQVTGRSRITPYFPQSVATAPDVAHRLTSAHHALSDPAVPLLAREAALQEALASVVTSLGEEGLSPMPVGRERRAVREVRAYLEENACEDVSLEDLAGLCGLSPFHLTRVFRQEVGLPPHAY